MANNSSCTTAKADPHGGFMRLPFEIRSRIYHYLFTGVLLTRVPNHGRRPVQPSAESTGYPPILLSNRAIRDEALSPYYQLVDFRLVWNQDYESIIPPSGDFHVPFRLRDGLGCALIQQARLRISCEAFQPLWLALNLPLLFEGMTSLKKCNLIYEMTKWEDLHIGQIQAHCVQFRRDRAWNWGRMRHGIATGEEIVALCMGVMSMHFHTQAELLRALAWVWVREFKRVSLEVTIEYSWVRLIVMDDHMSTPAAASYFNKALELSGFQSRGPADKGWHQAPRARVTSPDVACLSPRETLEDSKMWKNKLLREWLMLLKEVIGLVTDSDVGLLEFENLRL